MTALVAGLGPTELLIILAVLVLLFGASKLPELARGSGRVSIVAIRRDAEIAAISSLRTLHSGQELVGETIGVMRVSDERIAAALHCGDGGPRLGRLEKGVWP